MWLNTTTTWATTYPSEGVGIMAVTAHRPWCPAGLLGWTPSVQDLDTVTRYMGHRPNPFKEAYPLTKQFLNPTVPADVVAVQAVLKMTNQE